MAARLSALRADRVLLTGRFLVLISLRGWVDPRATAGLDVVDKWKFLTLPGLEFQPLGRPARSQSLYRLSYPGSISVSVTCDNYMGYRSRCFLKAQFCRNLRMICTEIQPFFSNGSTSFLNDYCQISNKTDDILTYCHVYECDCRRGLDWWFDLLTTYTHDSSLHFTDHCHTQTSVLILLQSPLAVSL
jgi:hypothetical protein